MASADSSVTHVGYERGLEYPKAKQRFFCAEPGTKPFHLTSRSQEKRSPPAKRGHSPLTLVTTVGGKHTYHVKNMSLYHFMAFFSSLVAIC